MQAYEFITKPQDGIIHIPEEYRNRITSKVKVIILEKTSYDLEEKPFATRRSDLLLSPSINTDGWTFSREEAN
jgi:hypothetical protein